MYEKIEKTIRMLYSVTILLFIAILSGLVLPVAAAEEANQQMLPVVPNPIPRQYIISQDGSGDFLTIQEGVNAAVDGDILIIYPGIYNENVEIMNKELTLMGISRDVCILQYDTAFYRKVPLTIAAGTVSNLTIYGMDSGVEQAAPTAEEIEKINQELIGDSWERQKNYSGYAVHIDQNFLFGRQLKFENCRIISENSHCVGAGSRGECQIIFEGCELISVVGGSCVYLHDPTTLAVGGTAALIMRNCYLKSYLCPYVMTFQSLAPENRLNLTFQNVRASAVAYEDSNSYRQNNVNTSLEVEALAALEKMGMLYRAGITSSAPAGLVHEMTAEESFEYMEKLENALKTRMISEVLAIDLPEGINYIATPKLETEPTANIWGIPNMLPNPYPIAKHQVLAVINHNNLPAAGWCGMNNAYLTPDSYGNTLIEMNAPVLMP